MKVRPLLRKPAVLLLVIVAALVDGGLYWLTDKALWSFGVAIAFVLGVALVVPLAYIAPAIPVAFHELGHVLAGWLVRYRLIEVNIGQLQIRRAHRGWTFRRTSKHMSSGDVWMLPIGTSHLKWRDMAVSLGGPIADFILFWASLLGAHHVWEIRIAEGEGHGFSVWFIALTLLAISAFGQLSGFTTATDTWNDAKFFSECTKPYGGAVAAYHAVSIQWHQGARARDWNRDFLALMDDERAPYSYRSIFRFMHFYVALDSEDFAEAERQLELASREVSGEEDAETVEAWAKWIAYERAHLYFLLGRDVSQLEIPVPANEDHYSASYRALIVKSIDEGELGRARELLAEARKSLEEENIERDNIRAEFEWLERLESRLRQAEV